MAGRSLEQAGEGVNGPEDHYEDRGGAGAPNVALEPLTGKVLLAGFVAKLPFGN